MKADEIRASYLEFFEKKGHRVVASDSLVPRNDPTLLFTGAGMNQFKDMFLGKGTLGYKTATTCQKCFRTGDIENVGHTPCHHTFFEMLGNFSFGDYFKRETIIWAWEYLTEVLRLPASLLRVSVYEKDDEAAAIWEKEVGVRPDWIYRYGEDDNFWPAGAPSRGPNGVCGPCSEIYYDQGGGCGKPDCEPRCKCRRFVEVWNLVFTQFDRKDGGILEPLPQKNIDTGMGLERVTAVLQGKRSNFETELFVPITNCICEMAEISIDKDEQRAARVRRIADHVRAVTFCIADGALPSNTERGYVVRKVLRRASVDGRELGIQEPFLYKLVAVVADIMAKPYPEVLARRESISRIIKIEEERFSDTLTQGLALLDQHIRQLQSSGSTVLPSKDAFKLYDTYGFPIDLAESILAEHGMRIDREGFEREMEEQRERARLSTTLGGVFAAGPHLDLKASLPPTAFTGYEDTQAEAKVVGIVSEGAAVESVSAGAKATIVLDRTPFYGESGGQVGDTGEIEANGTLFAVEDTQAFDTLTLHIGKLQKGTLSVGSAVYARVNAERRLNIMRNHTATHLLHRALRQVVGPHCEQAGSLVAPDRLRFDFTHFEPLTPEQIERVEWMVNEDVRQNSPVKTYQVKYKEARASGIIGLFTEKYGEIVRVVDIGGYSRELCGGTHLPATGYIGLFKIVSEESVSAGVRRIEATTGAEAYKRAREFELSLRTAAQLLGTGLDKVADRIAQLQAEVRTLRKELESARRAKLSFSVKSVLASAEELDGTKLVGQKLDGASLNDLRSASDALRKQCSSTAIVLGAAGQDKVSLIIALTDDLVSRGLNASELIREPAALLGGGGGGRPNLAQAGGSKPEMLDMAIQKALAAIRGKLSK